ncbi:MAG: hypothetical protein H6739_30000 [Alphaproteobacteria bacterium]|nr:hypothetical protein [Alphaproteobacteria bacterium]
MFRIAWTTWTRSFDHKVSADEAMRLVRDLSDTQSDPPVMVEVAHIGHPERAFTIGLGRTDTVLTYQESVDPPYFISKGVSESDVVMYCWGNEWTEYLGRNVVPLEVGFAALREFLVGPARPTSVPWESL